MASSADIKKLYDTTWQIGGRIIHNFETKSMKYEWNRIWFFFFENLQ